MGFSTNIARTSSQGLSHYNRSKTYNGYTLFTSLFGEGDVWLVDMEGKFIHQWRMPHRPGSCGRLLPNGNLLYGCKILGGKLDEFGGSAAKIIEVNPLGDIVWEYNDPYMSHDHYRMQNGNTMIIYWTKLPNEIQEKVKGGLQSTEQGGDMWGDCLKEVSPDGEIVWEWIGYEHMDPDVDLLCPLCGRTRWANANSVFVLDNGDVLLSFRFTNMIAIIDRDSGEIKWRWGPGEIAHPHDPKIIENGNMLIFDNGFHRNSQYDWVSTHSRIVELNPETKEIVWEYKDDAPFFFFSFACGSCQRLPNGNTFICESFMGRIFEVTYSGEIVWEYVVPFYNLHPDFGMNNVVFKAFRYGKDYEGIERIKDTSITVVASDETEKKVQARLKHLGY